MESLLLFAALITMPPVEDHWTWLPTERECQAFFEQASRDIEQCNRVLEVLGWPDGGGWFAQQHAEMKRESEAVKAFWWHAWYVRWPRADDEVREEHAERCIALLEGGLNVLPVTTR